jgi:hypothetical protein
MIVILQLTERLCPDVKYLKVTRLDFHTGISTTLLSIAIFTPRYFPVLLGLILA